MSFLKERLLWVGIAVVIIVLLVFGVAMMGSVVGAKPQQLPVALVMLDQGASLPDGTQLAVGEMIRAKLLENKQLPVQWSLVQSMESVEQGLAEQSYYGALVLPENLSAGMLSLQTPAPQPAEITLMVNEGMNPQAVAAVKQMLGQLTSGLGLELSKQVLAMLGQQTQVISVSAAEALLSPFTVQERVLHPVGANNASGSAPNLLTQILWLGSMVTSVFLFLTGQKAMEKGLPRWKVVSWQMSLGFVMLLAASGLLVWMASSWYGMEIYDAVRVWMFLWFAGVACFLLQSALLSWIGLPAIGLLVLLLFFSMPVINMAPEFLPAATKDWLYAWTPFRFITEGLRSVMYYGQQSAASSSFLWWLAGVCLAVLAASGLKRPTAAARIERPAA